MEISFKELYESLKDMWDKHDIPYKKRYTVQVH